MREGELTTEAVTNCRCCGGAFVSDGWRIDTPGGSLCTPATTQPVVGKVEASGTCYGDWMLSDECKAFHLGSGDIKLFEGFLARKKAVALFEESVG